MTHRALTLISVSQQRAPIPREAYTTLACRERRLTSWAWVGIGSAMPTLWIHDGAIPPCPTCDAPSEDQLRKPDCADRRLWHCLICSRSRQPDVGWDDSLVPVSDVELRARNRAMSARVRARWQAAD
jgi:hypothetical protein